MTGMRGLYIFLSIVAITFMVLSAAASFALKGEAAWGDLLLNLSAEVFGILATVFFIERIIRSREERAWHPIKRLIYEKLRDANRDFEQDLPADLPQPTTALLREALDKITLQVRLRAILVNDVVDDILKNAYAQGRVRHFDSSLHLVNLIHHRSGQVLREYRTVLSEVLDTSAHLLEQALLDRLHNLDKRIVEALKLSADYWQDFSTSDSTSFKYPRQTREGESREEYENYLFENADEIFKPLVTGLAPVIQESTLLNVWIENELKRR
jgi:hypothetical protein